MSASFEVTKSLSCYYPKKLANPLRLKLLELELANLRLLGWIWNAHRK